MKVELEFKQKNLLVQETTVGVISIQNNSAERVSIPDPEFSTAGPALRVIDTQTGKSNDFRATSRLEALDPEFSPQPTPPPVRYLEPNETFRLPVNLLTWVGTLKPGRYSLQAVVKAEGVEAVSSPAEINVTAAPVVWVQTEPPSSDLMPIMQVGRAHPSRNDSVLILVAGLEMGKYLRVESSVRVGEASKPAQPTISVPPNGNFAQGQWVAWLEGANLAYAFVNETALVVAPKRLKLETAENILFTPVLAAVAEEEPPAAGYLFILQVNPEGKEGRILSVELAADGKASTPYFVRAPGRRPIWNKSFYSSNGNREALWMTEAGGEIRLHHLLWAPNQAPTAQEAIVAWKGRFVATDATLDRSDILRGATLLWTGGAADRGDRLQVLRWEISPEGKYKEASPVFLDWPSYQLVADCRLGINQEGEVCGLLADRENKKFWFDSEGKVTPAAGLAAAVEVTGIVFADPGTPLMQYFDTQKGVQYLFSNGKPYPSW